MKNAKQFLTLIGFSLMTFSFAVAQAPQGISYQAVARDPSGVLIPLTALDVGFSIHSGSSSGTVVYAESHTANTNEYGLFNLVIGQGTATTGSFADIDWHEDEFFLEVTIDGNSIGTSQLISVPYALAVAPRTQYYSIPGAAFQLNNNGGSFYNSIGQGGAEVTQTGGSVTNVLNAQVNLPHGATIQNFKVFFKDESATEDLSIALNRENMTSGLFSSISTIVTSGSTAGWRSDEVSVPDVLVDNITYGHFIRVFCGGWDAAGTKAIKGVLIEYRY